MNINVGYDPTAEKHGRQAFFLWVGDKFLLSAIWLVIYVINYCEKHKFVYSNETKIRDQTVMSKRVRDDLVTKYFLDLSVFCCLIRTCFFILSRINLFVHTSQSHTDIYVMIKLLINDQIIIK